MPLRFAVKPEHEPNRCLECGEVCRRPKRFCSDSHKELWLAGRRLVLDYRGIGQVEEARKSLGITPQALEWKRRWHVSRPF